MQNYVKRIFGQDFINNEYIIDVTNTETVYIQQDNNISYSVQGNIGDKQLWFNMSLINISNYSIVQTANEKGMYIIDTSGLDNLKIILSEAQEGANLLIRVVSN